MKKIIYSALAVLLISTACSEEFTDIAPVGVLESSTFFEKESNAEEALIGLYDLMQFNYAKDWSSAFFLKQIPGDAANAGGPVSDDQPQLQEIDDHTNISISNPSIESVWAGYYKTIALANTIINTVEAGSLGNKEFVIAEAKFMRAWCYFELTTMWGDVPLRLVNPTEISPLAFAVPKSTRAEVYKIVEADLTAAIAGLPEKGAVSHVFRVSKGTAQATLGKVLVFQGKNTAAIPLFEAVISNASYDLETDVADVYLEKTEFGIESLFELGFISTNGVDWGNVAWGGRVESNLHVQLMGPRGDGVFDLTGTDLINGWGFNLPTDKLVKAFEAAGDVKRKAATVMTEGELNLLGGSYDATKNHWDYEGAIRTKYATSESQTSSSGVKELNYTTNWRVFRYAEVLLLLLAAEAYNAEGQDAKARVELNKIRLRAGLADVSATLAGTDLFDAIVNEKYLELAHEGQRFWDLVRWGKANAELAVAGYTSKNDLFPIPLAEISKNEALTTADQNPGY